MAVTAYRAGNRCATRNRGCLPEGGRDRSATGGRVGMAVTAKPAKGVTTGSDEIASGTSNPDPNPENPPSKGKAKAKTAKPAKEVTTGFGVELSGVGKENLRPAAPSLSACKPFR